MDLKNINNNIISNRWKERCEKLPDEIKEKLNELDNSDVSEMLISKEVLAME